MTLRKETKRIQELARKWRDGTITDMEKTEFDGWYNTFDDSELEDISGETPQELKERLYRSILEQEGIPLRPQKPTIRLWPRVAAAASVILCLSLAAYYTLRKQQAVQIAQVHDITPGGNKAILSSGGRQFILDSTRNGLIVRQRNIAVNKKANGQLVYNAEQNESSTPVVIYDTLTTPRGGQYQLKLADGTKMWLNAATQVRYPEHFTGKERLVELLSGEAYFEVKHDATTPFRVLVKGQVVEDIGTQFNINAYTDEPFISTTLIEGSVKVAKGGQAAFLKPGQQSIIQSTNNSITVRDADTDEATAWKNGDFIFNNRDLASIMRQLSRWYNIDVSYKDNVGDLHFGGLVSRDRKISAVLAIMESTGKIHFEINGRRIMVIAGKR